MAMVALAILAFLIILMTGTNPLFRAYSDVYTYMDDSNAMAEGATPVRLNGILIGKVRKIELSGVPDPNRAVKITLSIDDADMAKVPVDSTLTLSQQNLLGSKFVNITKGRSTQTIQPGAEIMSADTPEIQDLVKQGSSTLAGLEIIVKRMDGIISSIEAGNGTIGKLLVDTTLYDRAVAIVDEVHKLAKTLNESDGTLGKFIHDPAMYTEFTGTATRVNDLLDGLSRGEGTAGKLLKDPAAYDDLRAAIADVRKLLAGLNAGEGSAGKLLKSNELHDQIISSLAKVDALLDKISNGPGTIPQLLNNPALYEDLDATTREIQAMMKDFRANPKKFLTIQLKLW
jgi:phospholipid/cholesterol/gamma-HCH transport system substrate-binding protein